MDFRNPQKYLAKKSENPRHLLQYTHYRALNNSQQKQVQKLQERLFMHSMVLWSYRQNKLAILTAILQI